MYIVGLSLQNTFGVILKTKITHLFRTNLYEIILEMHFAKFFQSKIRYLPLLLLLLVVEQPNYLSNNMTSKTGTAH